MHLIKSAITAVAAAAVFGISLTPAMAKEESALVGDSVKALKAVTSRKSGIPPALVKDAVAIAIFPGVAKVDLMAKGKMTRGFLMARDGEGKWGAPLFLTLSGGTLGWQIVAQPMDIVLLFKQRKNIDELVKGKLALGVKAATVAQGPLGKSLKGATDEQMKADISAYILAHGEFADATVAGAALQVDAAADGAFYGKAKADAAEIVAGKVGDSSADLKTLHTLLTDYANRK